MALRHLQLIRAEFGVECEHGGFEMRAATTKVPKASNYDWEILIWVLYDRQYRVLEAWQWDVSDYRTAFDTVGRLSPAMMRAGHPLHLGKPQSCA